MTDSEQVAGVPTAPEGDPSAERALPSPRPADARGAARRFGGRVAAASETYKIGRAHV